MKIAINRTIQDGPWGGGNQFLREMVELLEARDHQVVYQVRNERPDIVLVVEPRRRSKGVTFSGRDVLWHLIWAGKHRPVVVHRINECDERKGTRTMNFRLRAMNSLADHTVFVGSWLKDLRVWYRHPGQSSSVILNGATASSFFPLEDKQWSGKGPMKLVTHHWSNNWSKGFDVYKEIDRLLPLSKWKGRISFTYIGNPSREVSFQNTSVLSPMSGLELGDELRSHHVYVTGSQNEPGSMHQIEGMMCGLPVVFRNSGALPEYCAGFGEMFAGPQDIEAALERMIVSYDKWEQRVRNISLTSERMAHAYLKLFQELLGRPIEQSKRIPLRDKMFGFFGGFLIR
jgi:glycosyltransferase involved in cell wall biosynthesis